MKKLFISLLLILFVMSSFFVTTVFAEESTPDTPSATEYVSKTPGLDAETELQIKQDVIAYAHIESEYTADDITLEYFGEISGGFKAVRFSFYGMQAPDIIYKKELGNYIYQVDGTEEVYLYRNHNFYSIIQAYEDGLIDDGQVEELAQILPYFSKIEQPTISIEETKSVSSNDTAKNLDNSSGSVQTGQNEYSVIFPAVVALLSMSGFLLLSKRRNK